MSEYEVVVDDAIEELTDLLSGHFVGSIPREIREKLDAVQHAANKLAQEADRLEMAWEREQGHNEDLQDEIRHSESVIKDVRLECQASLCAILGGSLHPDDPDPYGHHGLSQEHRREVILFRESQRLFAE